MSALFITSGSLCYSILVQRKYNAIRSIFDPSTPRYKKKDIILPINANVTMPPVLDQQNLGSCVSNAMSNLLRFHMNNVPVFQPSCLYIYWNTRIFENFASDQDTGSSIGGACKSINKYKYCDEVLWPYVVTQFSTKPSQAAFDDAQKHPAIQYTLVDVDLISFKEILQREPIIFAIVIYESFEYADTISTGFVPLPDKNKEKKLGGHCLLMCGYNDSNQTFTCQNSWGTYFGNQGYFYIPYNYITDKTLSFDFLTIKYI